MAPSPPLNRPFRANRLSLPFCALILAGPIFSQIRPAAPPDATAPPEARQPLPSRSGTILYHGVERTYKLVNGFAVHDGDMVLGQPGRTPTPLANLRPPKSPPDDSLQRRDLAPVPAEGLWPGGIIPYVIEPGFTEEALQDIQAAIDHWNAQTVLTLTPRTAEPDFVRFLPESFDPSDQACRANLGRVGGEQSIWLVDPEGCGFGATVHEIGHAAGLGHEHQRVDRDDFVTVSHAALHGAFRDAYTSRAPIGGPYDYASVMHYGGVETIPPGMLVGGEELSPGDIDGVARLYGQPSAATTVSTNPPGLELIVDGQRVTTPARFAWLPASEHVLEAPRLQAAAGARYLFGRWNDQASRRRTVTAHPASTWLEANYIVQRSVLACADPPDAGTVEVRPPSPDSFHTIRMPVAVAASPAPDGSREFVAWRTLGGGGRIEGGESANPGSIALQTDASPGLAVSADFSAAPLFRVDSNLEGHRLRVNGEEGGRPLPWAFPANELPHGFAVDVPEVEPEDFAHADARYRFSHWSDGGSRTRTVPVPAAGGSLTLNLAPEYRLGARVRYGAPGQGSIQVSPESEDGFYPADTQVAVTAVPEPGRHFAGWIGDVSAATASPLTLTMDGPQYLEALFTLGEPLRSGETQDIVLPASRWPQLYHAADGHSILVPADAIELAIEFQSSSPSAEVDLYARRDEDVWWSYGGPDGARTVDADFESATRGANERLVINRASNPPLRSGLYFIALDAHPARRSVRGTLSVSLRRSGIARASPRAFTFSSPDGLAPAPQTVRLFHGGNGPSRFRVESDRTWLTAHPREWTRTGPGIEELSIAVNSAALVPGTHRGTLRILTPDPARPSGATPTGIELPVAFVHVGQLEPIPAVSGVEISSAPQAGGTYGAGEQIEIQVHFTRPVSVTGSPELALAVGGQTRLAAWNSHGGARSCGDAYASLAFAYTVQRPDADPDGIGVPADGLTLNGGTIRNSAGADARLPLGRFALSDAVGHGVDGSQATVPEVEGLWISTRPHSGDIYGLGETIEMGLQFSIEVKVTGAPRLALAIGGRRVQAALSGSAGKLAWFAYVIQADDLDLDGIGIPADALSLAGGSIRSLAGANARLALGSHAIANASAHNVDGGRAIAPGVERLQFRSRPQDGDVYGVGEAIELEMWFNLPVQVDGSPSLALVIGDRRVQAALNSSGGTWASFRYVVQANDRDADGISIPADALALAGGSIRTSTGADARLALGNQAIANAPGHKVDGSRAPAPTVRGLVFGSRPQEGEAYGLGEPIRVGIWFSVDIEVKGSPQLALLIGDRRVQAAFSRQLGSTLWFQYVVQAADRDPDGIGVPADALLLNGGAIESLAGAQARLALGDRALAADPEHKVDGSLAPAPAIQGLRFHSEPQDGATYGIGEPIVVGLRFGIDVEVQGSPQLDLLIGSRRVQAAFSQQQGNTLWFRYVVQAADRDADGIGIPADALSLNGGSIRRATGQAARLDLHDVARANDADHKVDGSLAAAPAVRGLRFHSQPRGDGVYGPGETIEVHIEFGVEIEVTGRPQLALVIGERRVQASYAGKGSTVVGFRYAVAVEDSDPDGIDIPKDALSLNGGAIRGPTGLDALLDLGSYAVEGAYGHRAAGRK